MQPKISIIIPIYNSEKYLRECLDSIINQTLKDLEIICVVNGSTDSSLAIARSYTTADNRVGIIEKKEADLGAARNSGIRKASGEYLMFVDSDDWIKLDACEKLYRIAKDHDLDILQGDFKNIPKKYFRDFKCKHELINRKMSGLDFWNNNKNITGMVWDKLWKKAFFIENELFYAEGIYYEDGFTSFKGYIHAKSFMFANFTFYNYRKVQGSIMNQPLTQKHIESSDIKNKLLEAYIKSNSLTKEPCLSIFFFKQIFIHYALFNRKNISELKKITRNIDKDLMKFSQHRVRLAYYAPLLAACMYPFWYQRNNIRILISTLLNLFNTRITGTASFHRNF